MLDKTGMGYTTLGPLQSPAFCSPRPIQWQQVLGTAKIAKAKYELQYKEKKVKRGEMLKHDVLAVFMKDYCFPSVPNIPNASECFAGWSLE